jgi:hypothetical protein
MNALPLFFAMLFAHGASAQQPAPAQQPPKPVEPCQLVVPASLSVNMERVPVLQCDCRITKFKGKVYNRWGQELFATEDAARFPGELLLAEKLESGTYYWLAEYTAIHGLETLERKSTGYFNVLK